MKEKIEEIAKFMFFNKTELGEVVFSGLFRLIYNDEPKILDKKQFRDSYWEIVLNEKLDKKNRN